MTPTNWVMTWCKCVCVSRWVGDHNEHSCVFMCMFVKVRVHEHEPHRKITMVL